MRESITRVVSECAVIDAYTSAAALSYKDPHKCKDDFIEKNNINKAMQLCKRTIHLTIVTC